MGYTQNAAALVSAKLDLTRRVCGENFVQPKVEILIAKFVDE